MNQAARNLSILRFLQNLDKIRFMLYTTGKVSCNIEFYVSDSTEKTNQTTLGKTMSNKIALKRAMNLIQFI